MAASCLPWLHKKYWTLVLCADVSTTRAALPSPSVAGAFARPAAAVNGQDDAVPTSSTGAQAADYTKFQTGGDSQRSADAVRDSLIISTTSEIITIVTLSGGVCIYQNPASISWLGHFVGAEPVQRTTPLGCLAEVPKATSASTCASARAITSHMAKGLRRVNYGVLSKIFAGDPEKLELMMEELQSHSGASLSEWKGLVRVNARTPQTTSAGSVDESDAAIVTAGPGGDAAASPIATAALAPSPAAAAVGPMEWPASPSAISFRSFCSCGVDSGGDGDGRFSSRAYVAEPGRGGDSPAEAAAVGGGTSAKGLGARQGRHRRCSLPTAMQCTSAPLGMGGNPALAGSHVLASTPGMVLSLSERLQLELQLSASYSERCVGSGGVGGRVLGGGGNAPNPGSQLDLLAGDVGDAEDLARTTAEGAELGIGMRTPAASLSTSARALWGGGSSATAATVGGEGGGGGHSGRECPTGLQVLGRLMQRMALSPHRRHSLDSLHSAVAPLSPIPSSSKLPHLSGATLCCEAYGSKGFPASLALKGGGGGSGAGSPRQAAARAAADRPASHSVDLASGGGATAVVAAAVASAVAAVRNPWLRGGEEPYYHDVGCDNQPVGRLVTDAYPTHVGSGGGDVGRDALVGGDRRQRAKLASIRSAGHLSAGASAPGSGSGTPWGGGSSLRRSLRSLLSRVVNRSLTIEAVGGVSIGGKSGSGGGGGPASGADERAATAATELGVSSNFLCYYSWVGPGTPSRRCRAQGAVDGAALGSGFPSQRRHAVGCLPPVSDSGEELVLEDPAAASGTMGAAATSAALPLHFRSAPAGGSAAQSWLLSLVNRAPCNADAPVPPRPPSASPSMPVPSASAAATAAAAELDDLPVRATPRPRPRPAIPPRLPHHHVAASLTARPATVDGFQSRYRELPDCAAAATSATVRQLDAATTRSCRRFLSVPPDSVVVARTMSCSAGVGPAAAAAGRVALLSSSPMPLAMPLHAVAFAGSLRTAPPAALFLAAGTSSLKRVPSARPSTSGTARRDFPADGGGAATAACGGSASDSSTAAGLGAARSPSGSDSTAPSQPHCRPSFEPLQGLSAEGAAAAAEDPPGQSATPAASAAAAAAAAAQRHVAASTAAAAAAAAMDGGYPGGAGPLTAGASPRPTAAAAAAAALLAPAGGGGAAAAAVLAAALGGDGGGSAGRPGPECWHEVWARRALDPILGQEVIIVAQHDVTARVVSERHLALVMETEHRLLEQLYPRHILQGIVEDWTASANGHLCTTATEAAPAPASASLPAAARAPSRSWRPGVRDPYAMATWHPQVTLLFADICGFTPLCNELEPRAVMHMLNDLFSRFDAQLDKCGVFKVETIGDCYFVAGGLVDTDEDGMTTVRSRSSTDLRAHAMGVFRFGQFMLAAAQEVTIPSTGRPVQIRIGIHSGPVVSGIVGTRMPRFCLFGDTVNTASRMESAGVPGGIHVSEVTYQHLANLPGWQSTGGIEVKGKGHMKTYLYHPQQPAIAV